MNRDGKADKRETGPNRREKSSVLETGIIKYVTLIYKEDHMCEDQKCLSVCLVGENESLPNHHRGLNVVVDFVLEVSVAPADLVDEWRGD